MIFNSFHEVFTDSKFQFTDETVYKILAIGISGWQRCKTPNAVVTPQFGHGMVKILKALHKHGYKIETALEDDLMKLYKELQAE